MKTRHDVSEDFMDDEYEMNVMMDMLNGTSFLCFIVLQMSVKLLTSLIQITSRSWERNW